MKDTVLTLAGIADWAGTLWVWSGIAISIARLIGRDMDSRGMRAAKAVFHELRPFYRPMVIGHFAVFVALQGWSWWLVAELALDLFLWWLYKDIGGGDDRWKRRRRKAVEKVQALGGRLVVVPAGAR